MVLLPVLLANSSNSLPNSLLFSITTSCACLPLKPCATATFTCCAVNLVISALVIPKLPTSLVACLTLLIKPANFLEPSLESYPSWAKLPPLSFNASVNVAMSTPAVLADIAKSIISPLTPSFKPWDIS